MNAIIPHHHKQKVTQAHFLRGVTLVLSMDLADLFEIIFEMILNYINILEALFSLGLAINLGKRKPAVISNLKGLDIYIL